MTFSARSIALIVCIIIRWKYFQRIGIYFVATKVRIFKNIIYRNKCPFVALEKSTSIRSIVRGAVFRKNPARGFDTTSYESLRSLRVAKITYEAGDRGWRRVAATFQCFTICRHNTSAGVVAAVITQFVREGKRGGYFLFPTIKSGLIDFQN